ncbi:MAG: M20/M25/M40 family metallo-hydrolase [Candidatus Nanopelagicales bacterium]
MAPFDEPSPAELHDDAAGTPRPRTADPAAAAHRPAEGPGLLALPEAESDVVELVRALIRIDTTNAGDRPETMGEWAAAEYADNALREAGFSPQRFATTSASRAGLVLRIPGTDPDSADRALLLHGHLDVVPAAPRGWTHPPFAAEVAVDPESGLDMIWGRGAVDMKDMVGMILAVARHWARTGMRPKRDVVVLLLPDEEHGGLAGSHWLVDHRPELFAGVTEAVGEVGGFSMTVRDDLRLYLVQTAERGMAWLQLRAAGRAGHGSMLNDDNAVTHLCQAVARLGEHRFPVRVTPTTRAFIAELSDATGTDLDPLDAEGLIRVLGPLARIVGATLTNTMNPTMLSAGNKVNVIPGEATAALDARFLPGHEEELFAAIDQLLGDRVVREFIVHDEAVETTFDGPTVEAMAAALRAHDPGARAVPYTLSAGTDAKAFSRLGIRCFGFAPLRLPPTLDFGSLFHGVDERVPIDGLQFGVRVLDRFLRSC